MFGIRAQSSVLAAIFLLLTGCRSPFTGQVGPGLKQIVDQAIAAATAAASAASAQSQPDQSEMRLPAPRPESDVIRTLQGRLNELDAISPQLPGDPNHLELGPDLMGGTQQHVNVNLKEAITGALSRNLGTQAARLVPGIATQDIIQAQAVFDFVLFSNADLAWIDEPQTVPIILGNPVATPFNTNQSYRFGTGIRKQFSTGAEATISTDLSRYHNQSPGLVLLPDPAYTPSFRLGVTQPLLRGFGSDVTQATIRIAQNTEQRAVEDLRTSLMQVALDTEHAYWNLVQAWRDLAIREWLVTEGVNVRQILDRRREHDTSPAEYSDAVARVEQRKANVIRARRAIRAASDALKVLINDPQLSVGSEAVLWPQDDVTAAAITYNLRESMMSAIDHRPEVQRAILDIDDAAIRQRVAGNARLPLLNLSAEMAYFGLDRNISDAYSEMNEGRFIDYLLGLNFEYPLGNRAADAGYQQARLRRSAAIINYQRAVQDVTLDVKKALRDVLTNYELSEATRSFRIAQAENLRTLRVEAQKNAAFTPEFLNLMFNRQESLALAQFEEVAALVNFDKSIAALHRAMGTGLEMRGVSVEQME